MLLTDQEIKIKIGDAPEFIKLLNKIMATIVWQYSIKEVCIIRIKNWFDHKWLNFSGKAIVPFRGGIDIESAFEEKWQDNITVPPFHPRRVLSETYFRKNSTGNKAFEKRLHTGKNSIANMHNRIVDKTKNGLFLWYSSETEINKKGSIMIYRVQNKEVHPFYATIAEKNNEWLVTKAKGIELNELKLITSNKMR